MVRGFVFTLGGLMALGGFLAAAITVAGAAMSDSPSASVSEMGDAKGWAIFGVFGVVVCLVAAYAL